MEVPDRQTSPGATRSIRLAHGPTLFTHTPTYQDRLILARLVWPSSWPAQASPHSPSTQLRAKAGIRHALLGSFLAYHMYNSDGRKLRLHKSCTMWDKSPPLVGPAALEHHRHLKPLHTLSS
ncbi:hypothetical protein PGT21_030810 [Puccinia graminis f. sp. tritici]|uniref:Uncharacterized protein n=1 Tax=Puccinia graminis f. sp. tritici TaxID=56615 RepID=A0A5B0MJH9_PUCGR|nr:hypothetical protein PGTUg99_030747 [Puccinia graminis f. sp. tritici]KAA1091301.1 hypothetical protein PGT21_030810 [Puccinia graminis f. sp. tritici]